MQGGGAALAVGAGLASMVMLVRVAVLTAVAGPTVLGHLGPFLGAAAVGGVIAIALLARSAKSKGAQESGLSNPFQLREAIRFGIIFAIVLLVVEAARRYGGGWGIAVASLLAGFVDVDAITLSLSGMSAGGGVPVETAAGGIAVAVLANTAAKAGYAAWRGSPEYRNGVALILGSSLVAGVIAIVVLGIRP